VKCQCVALNCPKFNECDRTKNSLSVVLSYYSVWADLSKECNNKVGYNKFIERKQND